MYLPLGSFTGIVGMFPYFLYWKIFNVFYLKLILLQNLKGMFNVPFPIINTYISSARGFKFLSASSQSNVKYFPFSFLIKLLSNLLSILSFYDSYGFIKSRFKMSRIPSSQSSIFANISSISFPKISNQRQSCTI